MELTQEQLARVQAQVPVVGLLTTFYRNFGEDACKVSKEFALQFGKQTGKQLFALTQEEVEVSGIVWEKQDKRLITVKEYSVIKDAGSRGDSFAQKPMVPEI